MPGRLLARTACFPTALGAVGEEFDTGGGAVEQMLARGGPAPPSVPVRPFFISAVRPFPRLFFLLPLCLFSSSLLSARFFIFASVRPPLRPSLHFRLPTFTFPPSAPTVLSALCRHTLPLSARFFFSPLSRLPLSTRSVRLSFPLPLPVHFSFPPLSPAVFYAFWQSTFSPISLRLSFFSPLAVWLSPRFRPPFFPFAAVCPPAFSFSCHPPFSIFCPSAFLHRFSLSACLAFPHLLSIVLSAFSLRPVCPIFLSTPAPAYFSPPSLRPSFSPPFVNLSFPPPLPPALLSIRLPSVRPPGEKGGRPLDI